MNQLNSQYFTLLDSFIDSQTSLIPEETTSFTLVLRKYAINPRTLKTANPATKLVEQFVIVIINESLTNKT